MGETSYLANLPIELVYEIATYLSIPELGVFMRTNKELYHSLLPQIIKQAIEEDDRKEHLLSNLTRAAVKDNPFVFDKILEKTKPERLSECKLLHNENGYREGISIVHVVTGKCKPIYLRRLLERGANVNIRIPHGPVGEITPIMQAVRERRTDNIQVLLEFGANINDHLVQRDTVMWTPIHMAMAVHDLEMVDFLIRAGANLDVMTGHYNNISLLTFALDWVEGLQLVLEKHQFGDEVLTNALGLAIVRIPDFYFPAKYLLRAGATFVYDMLWTASQLIPVRTARSLDLLARLATADDRNDNNLTALHVVEYAENAQVLIHSIPGILDAPGGQQNWTPLQYMYFCFWIPERRERARRSDVAAVLIKNGARIDFLKPPYGRNVLFCACEMGHVSAVKEILAREPAMLDSRDTLGNTPLHIAASSADSSTLECMKLLIEADCDVNAQNNLGMTALHCTSFSIPIPDAPKKEYLDQEYTAAKVIALIEADADIFLRGTRDWTLAPRTALIEAIACGYVSSAMELVDAGIGLLENSKLRGTALEIECARTYLVEGFHASTEHGYIEVVRRILQSPDEGVSPQAVSPAGDNIFHCLARGAISMAMPGLAMMVGWRMLGYQMPKGWEYPFNETYVTDEGRHRRYFYQLADELCQQRHLLPLALEKNKAGVSALDIYKQAFPMMNWDMILQRIQDSMSKGEDLHMPIPYQPTADLVDDYDRWVNLDI